MDGSQPCAQVDPEIFFPDPSDRAGIARAKEICNTCNFIEECLASAVWEPKLEGIWGGTTPRQRETIRTRLRKLGKDKTKV
jgi:WhiB family redox-sensing transcriptional regulator